MSVTGIVAALAAEARTLGPLPDPTAGAVPIHTLSNGTLLAISGMGAPAATQAAQALIHAGARSLLSFGLAGGLAPHLLAGAVLLPDRIVDSSGRVHGTYAPWRERLAAQAGRLTDARPVVAGTVLSVAQPLVTVESKSQALERTGACATDMESFAIAAVAAQLGVNFAVLRVVVDTAQDRLPGCVMRATGPQGQVNGARLLGGVLRAPWELGALLRLARRYRTAMERLRTLGRMSLVAP